MISIAAFTARLRTPSTDIQLFPAGVFRARDGRPTGITGWRMDAASARELIALSGQRQTPFVIDYEHQTLYAETSGNPAPAAGWFERLEWREGDGLYAVDVEWTARATAMIEGDEYRYLSPVFKYDKNGAVTELLMVAAARSAQLTSGAGSYRRGERLTEEELTVCRALGTDPVEFLRTKQKQAMNAACSELYGSAGPASARLTSEELAVCRAMGYTPDEFLSAKMQ
ncbi:phage protease [Marinobacter salsuginis]|uniref:phage protease n=1 Tax=Marinobacter salsuginis TaxID=418719 RepID=UPI00273D76BB|nr:phage protease [Marinobacter salsuginis]